MFCLLLADTNRARCQASEFSAEDLNFFERDVRPILVQHCYECHGARKQEAGLRLDSRDAILRGGDEGPVVSFDEPSGGRLMQAIRRDGELKMPPDAPLSAEQIQSLTRWVQLQLPWPAGPVSESANPRTHWAFLPPTAHELPGRPQAEAHNRIDAFVSARLEQLQLQPSPPAQGRELARRLAFDLHGLPASSDDVYGFLQEERACPDAYERLVDRWLSSPVLGERWARHWLDVARYADNKGYVFFEEKNYPWAYVYRDYVIESLNHDLPFSRFVMEQLAADQLDTGNDHRPLRALGFMTLGPHFMNNVHDIADDRIDVITRGLMGLTVTCARCHDHKYDPISQAEYYGLYGVMRSSEEPLVAPLFAEPEDTEEYRKFALELGIREGKLNDFIQSKHRELVQGGRTRVAEYLLAIYAARNQPAMDDFMLIADTADINPAMSKRWRSALEKALRNSDPLWLAWHRLSVPAAERLAEESPAIVRDLLSLSDGSVHPAVRSWLAQHSAITEMKELAGMYGELFGQVDKQWRETLAAAEAAGGPLPTELSDANAESVRRYLYGPTAPPDVPPVFGWGFLDLLPDRASQGEYQKLLKEVEQWLMTGPGAPARTTPLIDSRSLFEPRIFQRGNPLKLGPAVARQFLRVATADPQPFRHGSGRLELAQAVVSPENPLTARVIVNRFWLWHFGQAIVRTPSDFGLRSQPPTHPELLDDLTSRFVNSFGWSLKSLHRYQLLSATYL